MIRFDQPRQTLLCGPGSIAALHDELDPLGATRVCVISSPHASQSPAFEAVIRALVGVEVVHTFRNVRPHAPVADSHNLARAVDRLHVDAIVAYGGGSVSDTAKAVAILLAEGYPLTDHCSTFIPPDQLRHVPLTAPKVPVISIPTTLSGAEVTPGGGATDDEGLKRVFWDPNVASRVLVFDPLAVQDVPENIILTSGMNGLAHCAEALYSRTASPVTDALATEGARRFAGALPAYANGARDDESMTELLIAAYLGGSVISNARVGLHHAICHVLGALLGLPHGLANTVMLPYVLEFNADQTRVQQAKLSLALAGPLGQHLERPASWLARDVQVACELPTTLEQVAVANSDLDDVAESVMQDRGLFFNPRRVNDATEVRQVLENAWTGRLGAIA